MEYLSKKGFVHRDLAARNILVSGYHICKVSHLISDNQSNIQLLLLKSNYTSKTKLHMIDVLEHSLQSGKDSETIMPCICFGIQLQYTQSSRSSYAMPVCFDSPTHGLPSELMQMSTGSNFCTTCG